jgi:DNA ligase 4
MQPTPGPSYAADSQTQSQEDAEAPVELTTYPAPPQNIGSAPFSVLVGLFEKLQIEKKPERRRKLLDAWFNVCTFY